LEEKDEKNYYNFALNTLAWSQSISETYTLGNIPTTYNTNPTPQTLAEQPGILTITIPIGSTITGVDVVYDMTATNGMYMDEQRSYMRCTSVGGLAESQVYSGEGWEGGVWSYSREGLTIANSVTGGGDIEFELHAFRIWGGTGTNPDYSFVNNNTWTVTVHYSLPGAPGNPTNPNPANHENYVSINTDLSWTNGVNTDNIQVLMGTTNPPTVEVYNGAAIEVLTYDQYDGPLNLGTTYYWRVIASNDDHTTPGSVWMFTTVVSLFSESTTYSLGDIPTTYNTAPNTTILAEQPGQLTVSIPGGAVITGVDVHYDMTAHGGMFMGEQVSYLRCTSPGGIAESQVYYGDGFTGGLFSYSREELDIANNVFGGGDIEFELHAFRIWGGTGTNTDYGYVNNNTWTVIVYYDPVDAGSLDGYVYDQDTSDPIQHVDIQVLGTGAATTTNASGYYIFPAIQEGTYDVRASKFGYHEQIAEDVVIIEDETTELVFDLTMLDNVTVSGQIVGSDYPDIGLEDAEIILTGYESYQTISGANGMFSIPGVYSNQTYNINVTVIGYSAYSGEIEVEGDDLDLGQLIVSEIAYPPHSVIATQTPDDSEVDLIWNGPGLIGGTPQWIHWDDGVNNDAIGTGAAAVFSVAQRFTQNDIQDLGVGGLYITSMKFWPYEASATYTLKIWQGGGANPWNAGTEIHSQLVQTFTNQSWNEVALNNPVFINPDQELWFGYMVNTPTGYPAGCDAGPAIDGFGNMMHFNNVWDTLLNIAPTLDYNWNIHAYAGFPREQERVMLTHHNSQQSLPVRSTRNTRILEEYAVYRLLFEDINNEDNWVALATVNDTVYTDLSWDTVDSGFYHYAVKAVYTNNVFSDPAVSNWVGKDMTTNVIVNVTTDTGDSADGAEVRLLYQDQDPDGNSPVYVLPATGFDPSVVSFLNVLRGSYNLEISLPGFTTYTQTDIDIQQFTELDIEISEFPYPPENLHYTAGSNIVNLMWDPPTFLVRSGPSLSLATDYSDRYAFDGRVLKQQVDRYEKMYLQGLITKDEFSKLVENIVNESRDNGCGNALVQRETRELLGYNVYRNNEQINTVVLLSTSYTDTDVLNNEPYTYYVTAVYTLSESEPSNSINVVPGPQQLVIIGEDTTSSTAIPFNFYWRNSLSQTIYMQSEINAAGLITELQYFNTFSTNLLDMPIKIWMLETTQTDLTNGWVAAGEMELVFDGNIDFPSGENTISIELDEFFLYTGSANLMIMANRPMDTEYYNYLDNFYYSVTPEHPNRTRYINSDTTTYDPFNPPTTGTLNNWIPNTGLSIISVGMGTLMGHVHFGDGEPAAGTTVTVVDTPFQTYTDNQGYYFFPYVFEGPQTVIASHFGYYDDIGEDIDILENETVVHDFTLYQLPTVTLSGRIIGSDQPDVGLDNALIVMHGYQYYETNNDNEGYFTINEVYTDHVYDLTVQRSGYQTTTIQIDVGSEDLDLGNITVNELAFPAFNVIAAMSAENTEIDIYWSSPDSYQYADFRHDDGVASTSIGLPTGTANSVMGAVHNRYGILDSMSWYLSGNTIHDVVNLFVFGLDAQGLPDSNDILYEAAGVANIHGQWNQYEFPDEVEAPGGFMIGLSVEGTLGIAADDGIGEPYDFQDNTHYYSTDFTTGNWMTMESAGYNHNFLLRAQGFDMGQPQRSDALILENNLLSQSESIPIGNLTRNESYQAERVSNVGDNRVLIGYIVYRLLAGDEENQQNWWEVGTVTDTTYTDDGIGELLNGNYRYAVRSVYTNNVLSDPAFSNIVNYQEYIPNISNIQADVEEHEVTLSWEWMRSDFEVVANTRNSQLRNENYEYSTRAFEGFKITRNGPIIAEGIMEPYFVDSDLPAGTYMYTVIGVFTNGATNMLFIEAEVVLGNEESLELEPLITSLNGNYPNPFNPDTRISYSVREAAEVSVVVFNVKGQKTVTLVDRFHQPGNYEIIWNGKDSSRRDLSSGIYFYRMETGSYSSTQKMIMLK